MPNRTTFRKPATPSASPERTPVLNPHTGAVEGTQSRAGSNYGDFAPTTGSTGGNPSRGAQMERDVAPADTDFSRPPLGSRAAQDDTDEGASQPSCREGGSRAPALAGHQTRHTEPGNAPRDCQDAEAETDATDGKR